MTWLFGEWCGTKKFYYGATKLTRRGVNKEIEDFAFRLRRTVTPLLAARLA